MAYPSTTAMRSVGGSAIPTYITTTLSSTYVETTFTIAGASSWLETGTDGQATANPLGTSGTFTVCVDFGKGTEEHILCSAVNTSTGVVTIWTDGTNNGRGYGTPKYAHSVGSAGELTCFPMIGGPEFASIFSALSSIAGIYAPKLSPTLTPSSTSSVGLTVQGLASQTGNLQEWKNSAGTTLVSLSSSGVITLNSQKITGLANGTNPTDAATFGQIIPISTVTNAGDLIVGSGAGAVSRLGLGTANQVLTVNSGATGLTYATPATWFPKMPSVIPTVSGGTFSTGISNFYLVPTTSGTVTVTLPKASTVNQNVIGFQLQVGSNPLVINAFSGDTIQGATLTSIQLTAVGQSVFMIALGGSNQWNIIADSAIPASPTGFTAGGDLTGNYPNPTLTATGTAGTYGSASVVPVVTTDSKGRVTGVTNTNIAISALAASAQQDLYIKQVARTASATITNNEVAMFDTTSGPLICTLPSAGSRGQIAVVLTAGSNSLTINAATGQTINGSLSTITLTTVGHSVRMTSYQGGNTWIVLANSSVGVGASGFAVGGDLTGYLPNPTLNTSGTLASYAPLLSPSFTTPSLGVATATSINGTTIPSSATLVTTATTSLPNLTTVNGTSIPSSVTLITSGTTSLPNVTSVNGTTIPASAGTLLTSTSTSSALTQLGLSSAGFVKSDALGNLTVDTNTYVTPTYSGEISATDFKATGLTGATTATRYVGGTVNGAPTSGTFAVGDFIIDQTATIWVCITAGTPGTWSPTVSQTVTQSGSAPSPTSLGQVFVCIGGSSGVVATLPSSPIDGSTWGVINSNSNSIAIKANTGAKLLIGGVTYNAGTNYTVDHDGVYMFVYNNGNSTWYAVSTNDIGDTIGTLATSRGGTNLTTFTAANNAIYSTSSSALTAGTLPVLAGGTGATTASGSGSVVLATSPSLTNATISTTATTTVPLTVSGIASQTGNLQEWKNSAGTVLASFSSAGLLTLNSQKITGLANGTTATDAVAYGQWIGQTLTPVVKTTSNTAVAGDFVVMNGSGNTTTTLPTTPANGTMVGLINIGTGTASIAAGGSDTIRGSTTSGAGTSSSQYQTLVVSYNSASGVWEQVIADANKGYLSRTNSWVGANTFSNTVTNNALTVMGPTASVTGPSVNIKQPVQTATITNVTASAGTVTYTAANSFTAGNLVTITGVNPSGYNLSNQTIATASSTQFTVTNAATGTYVSGGTATSFSASQYALQVQNSAGTAVFQTGSLNNSTTNLTEALNHSGSFINVASASFLGVLSLRNYQSGNLPGLVVYQNGSQTGDLVSLRSTSANTLLRANTSGALITGSGSAPIVLRAVQNTAPITAIVGNGTTITVTANNYFSTGQTVVITGTTNYNGTYTIATATTSSFTITSATTGATSTGTATTTGQTADILQVQDSSSTAVFGISNTGSAGAPTWVVNAYSNKITGLANGTAATDAAAFGQLPVANGAWRDYVGASASLGTLSVTQMGNTVTVSGFTTYFVTFTNVATGTGSGTANAAINYSLAVSGGASIVSGGGTQTCGQLITTASTRGTYSYNTVLVLSSTASTTITVNGILGGSGNTLSVGFHQVAIVGVA